MDAWSIVPDYPLFYRKLLWFFDIEQSSNSITAVIQCQPILNRFVGVNDICFYTVVVLFIKITVFETIWIVGISPLTCKCEEEENKMVSNSISNESFFVIIVNLRICKCLWIYNQNGQQETKHNEMKNHNMQIEAEWSSTHTNAKTFEYLLEKKDKGRRIPFKIMANNQNMLEKTIISIQPEKKPTKHQIQWH